MTSIKVSTRKQTKKRREFAYSFNIQSTSMLKLSETLQPTIIYNKKYSKHKRLK